MVLSLDLRSAEPLGGLDADMLCQRLMEEKIGDKDAAAIFHKLGEWPSVNNCWFTMSDHLATFEQWHQRADFADRKLAALVLSRCHFMLQAYDRMLEWALKAADMFGLEAEAAGGPVGLLDKHFVEEVIHSAVSQYKEQVTSGVSHDKVQPAGLADFIDRIAADALAKKHYEWAVIYGYDLHRPDQMRAALTAGLADSPANRRLINVALELAESGVGASSSAGAADPTYKKRVLAMLVEIAAEQHSPDHERICQALIELDRAEQMSDELAKLAVAGGDSQLTAMQMAFDCVDGASQEFKKRLVQSLRKRQPEQGQSRSHADELPAANADGGEPAAGTSDEQTTSSASDADEQSSVDLLLHILSGDETIDHHMQFLIQNNHTDITIMKSIKDLVRHPITQNATVIANGLMHAGTTRDNFLRDNMEWVSKARNWAKFNTVASFGAIHRGHEKQAMHVLQPYLPPAVQLDAQGNPVVPAAAADDGLKFKEAGALMALGLIFAGHGSDEAVNYLRDQLRAVGANQNLKHGACLGIGLSALGTADYQLYGALREVLFTDDALAAEAAGLAMGLVMAGTMNVQVYTEMREYLVETKHDKIRRGLKLAIAMLHYGKGDEALVSINELLGDKTEPELRQTGVWAAALAYVGTGEPSAVALLLKVIANDPDKAAKRFAATAIGFITFNHLDDCVLYATQMVHSFDGFIRYGAAMMLGIGAAGTGNKAAIELIEPLLSAKEAYVRQGAVVALSLIMIQHNEHTCPRVRALRDKITDMVTEKSEEYIAKFGAILAQGILDAGGRNVTISFAARSGAASNCGAHADMPAVLGALCFLEHWYWHSLSLCIVLAFRPTCLIALNKELKMPKMQFECGSKASAFAYPPPLETKRAADQKNVQAAVLSVTAKAKKKLAAAATAAAKTKEPAASTKESSKEESGSSSDRDKSKSKSSSDEAATGEGGGGAKPQPQPEPSVTTAVSAAEQPMDTAEATPVRPASESASAAQPAVSEATTQSAASETQAPASATASAASEQPKAVDEPATHMVDNPARAMRPQLKLMSVSAGSRYEPLKPLSRGGLVMVRDTMSDHKEELVTLATAGGLDASGAAAPSAVRDDAPAPQPFLISLQVYKAM